MINRVNFGSLSGDYDLSLLTIIATPGWYNAICGEIPAQMVMQVSSESITRARGRRTSGPLDPASRLAELAADELSRPLRGTDPDRTGVFISSRCGNQQSVRRFASSLASGRRSPVMFSIAGYNIIAQSAARALPAHGPSVVLSGRRATLDGALFLGGLRLSGGAVDTAVAGHVSWTPARNPSGSGEGMCVLAVLGRAAGPASGSGQSQLIASREAFGSGAVQSAGLDPAEASALRRIASLGLEMPEPAPVLAGQK